MPYAYDNTVEAARLTQGLEARLTPGDDLVHVRLVARVPKQCVLRRIEHAMQCEGQFDDTKIRTEVARVFSDGLHDEIANLTRQLVEFVVVQCPQIRGFVDLLQDHDNRTLPVTSVGCVLAARGHVGGAVRDFVNDHERA